MLLTSEIYIKQISAEDEEFSTIGNYYDDESDGSDD